MVVIYCPRCQKGVRFAVGDFNKIDVSGFKDHKSTTNFIWEAKCPYCGSLIYKRTAKEKGF
jgi:ssDNA-binding Zn-finger/Zn-ribbon topoisomerase 1